MGETDGASERGIHVEDPEKSRSPLHARLRCHLLREAVASPSTLPGRLRGSHCGVFVALLSPARQKRRFPRWNPECQSHPGTSVLGVLWLNE